MVIYSIWIGGGDIPARYQEALNYSRERIAACGHEQQIIRIEPIQKTSPQMAANIKDHLVLSMACFNDAGFADCDQFVEYVPEMVPGKAYFAFEKGTPCVSLFYVNGCMGYFKFLQRKKDGFGILDRYGWPRELLRGEHVLALPDDSYTHIRVMTGNQKQGGMVWKK